MSEYQKRYDERWLETKRMLDFYVFAMRIKNMKRGLKRSWLFARWFIPFIRADIRYNKTTLAYIFDEKPKDMLATSTIQRAVDGPDGPKRELAVYMGEIMNRYDPGHIKL